MSRWRRIVGSFRIIEDNDRANCAGRAWVQRYRSLRDRDVDEVESRTGTPTCQLHHSSPRLPKDMVMPRSAMRGPFSEPARLSHAASRGSEDRRQECRQIAMSASGGALDEAPGAGVSLVSLQSSRKGTSVRSLWPRRATLPELPWPQQSADGRSETRDRLATDARAIVGDWVVSRPSA